MSYPPGEFALIARLTARLSQSRRVVLGPGDDCAVVAAPRAPQLVTIDSMVEGVHFEVGWASPEEIGARALTVNLSDIAAMGGLPTVCVVNLAIRAGLSARFFDRLYAGLGAAARAAGVDIVGGNVTRGTALAITIAQMGEVRGAPMRRDAAWPGDEIFVTGTLGDAAMGWRVLAGKLRARGAARKFVIDRWRNPIARLAAGQRLARIRPVPAAIDISDGLWQDLGHLLERSAVGARIEAPALPLSAAYRQIAGDDATLALSGGEDYELLFCLRPGASARALSRRLGVAVARIGVITRGAGAHLIGGAAPRHGGWDQLRGPG
ncbi:MAG: thiamine-phosphate kinase [Candidatus Binataceae bacterium]|nr:thiamine-phosphate kinase [Candidatus Binataceae bacterium]